MQPETTVFMTTLWYAVRPTFGFMPAGRWSPYLYVGGGVNHAEVKDFQPSSVGLEILTEKMHPAVSAAYLGTGEEAAA